MYSMRSGTSPDPGPTLDIVYVPGTPGADWTDEEVHVTRMRILQACFSTHLLLRQMSCPHARYMSQLLLLGKFEYGGGPIFKVVLEC